MGRSDESDRVDAGSDGSGMGMGRLGFEVAEVGRGGRERMVDIKPGMRRTTSFCMLCVFCEPLNMENNIRGED